MSFQKVTSSQIHSWSYEEGTNTLRTRFNCRPCSGSGKSGAGACGRCHGEGHGGVYEYEAVPAAIWGRLRDAESKGSAHGKLIRNGGYKFKFIPNGAEAA